MVLFKKNCRVENLIEERRSRESTTFNRTLLGRYWDAIGTLLGRYWDAIGTLLRTLRNDPLGVEPPLLAMEPPLAPTYNHCACALLCRTHAVRVAGRARAHLPWQRSAKQRSPVSPPPSATRRAPQRGCTCPAAAAAASVAIDVFALRPVRRVDDAQSGVLRLIEE